METRQGWGASRLCKTVAVMIGVVAGVSAPAFATPPDQVTIHSNAEFRCVFGSTPAADEACGPIQVDCAVDCFVDGEPRICGTVEYVEITYPDGSADRFCEGGTFFDVTQGISQGTTFKGAPGESTLAAMVTRTYLCPDEGTFEMIFNPHTFAATGGDATDRFVLNRGSDTFAGIHGAGTWSIYVSPVGASFGPGLGCGDDWVQGWIHFD